MSDFLLLRKEKTTENKEETFVIALSFQLHIFKTVIRAMGISFNYKHQKKNSFIIRRHLRIRHKSSTSHETTPHPQKSRSHRWSKPPLLCLGLHLGPNKRFLSTFWATMFLKWVFICVKYWNPKSHLDCNIIQAPETLNVSYHVSPTTFINIK